MAKNQEAMMNVESGGKEYLHVSDYYTVPRVEKL